MPLLPNLRILNFKCVINKKHELFVNYSTYITFHRVSNGNRYIVDCYFETITSS